MQDGDINASTGQAEGQVLGAFAEALATAGEDLWGGIDHLLDILRQAARAETAELFVAEPIGNDALLVACIGADREVFREQVRFPAAHGFPGIVLADGQTITTTDLEHDPRYLRRRVVRSGYQTCTCVPVSSNSGFAYGSMQLAWRQPTPPPAAIEHLLATAGRLLGTAIDADFAGARRRVEQWLRQVVNDPPEVRLRHLLRLVQAEARAVSSKLVLFGGETRAEARSIALRAADRLWMPHANCTPARCTFVADGHGIFVAPDWGHDHDLCSADLADGGGFGCIPLTSADGIVGVVQLAYWTEAQPRAAYLPRLLVIGRAIGQALARERTITSTAHVAGPQPLAPRSVRATDTPAVVIRCLGPFRLEIEGRVVGPETFVRRKAMDVLKILAANAGTPVSRYQIAESLWPESDETRAANRLYGLIHTLRKVFDDNSTRPGTLSRVICRQEGAYRLELGADVAVDVAEFQALHATARRLEVAGDSQGAMRALRRATDLYSGDLFEDDPYTDWYALERVRYQRQFLDDLEVLAAAAQAEDDLTAAVDFLQRALAWEPLREDLQQQLVRLLLAQGRREEAWAQYRECVWLVRSKLQMEPLAETLALEQLLQGA